MEGISGEQLIQEVDQIIHERIKYIQKYYPRIRWIYKTEYSWPEIDPLRWEISLCIIFGFFQAAMTLTNHFLESLLKYALIANDGLKNAQSENPESKQTVSDHFRETYGPGFAKYGDLDLGDTINRACKAGLITKEQKKQLHILREVFRNAWNHADKAKTFGATEMPVQVMHWGDDGIEVEPHQTVNVADLIVAQGFVQIEIAKREAPRYFAYVDGLARQICVKLFGEHYKSELGSLGRD